MRIRALVFWSITAPLLFAQTGAPPTEIPKEGRKVRKEIKKAADTTRPNYSLIDLNRDGQVSREEFIGFYVREAEERAGRSFSLRDFDQNGVISAQEMDPSGKQEKDRQGFLAKRRQAKEEAAMTARPSSSVPSSAGASPTALRPPFPPPRQSMPLPPRKQALLLLVRNHPFLRMSPS
ncbi:MAG: hypothetical protein AAF191_10455 [Verrucomicrobiota bacterium]